ncbi:MAG TPA: zinc ABC transporter substrate-binding protein [Candidatus Limnocylindrales bacterium]|nr:zinc ABC transporter substrate-binding protein [Candidatus Limnocylindrales bacterium]
MTLLFAALLAVLPLDRASAQSVAGCTEPQLNVAATVGMIADVAAHMGGSCVTVQAMMGPGVDPHLYSATLQDVELLFNADMIFYGGLNLEARMTGVLEQVGVGLAKPAIPVSEAIDPALRLIAPNTNVTDPHVWMDVSMWMQAAGAVRDGLVAALPDHQAYIEANAEAYLAEMAALDAYIHEQIDSVPAEQRVLVTAHDAFQYFGRAYGIEVFAPQGISTATEAGVQDIRRTIDLLVERRIPAIFVETSVSSDVIEAIQAGARSRGQDVVIGGSLFSDAMGAAGTPGGTYIGMIRSNVDTIARALRGEIQEEGASS